MYVSFVLHISRFSVICVVNTFAPFFGFFFNFLDAIFWWTQFLHIKVNWFITLSLVVKTFCFLCKKVLLSSRLWLYDFIFLSNYADFLFIFISTFYLKLFFVCVWCEVGVKIQFFSTEYPIKQVPFMEKSILSPLCYRVTVT